MPARIAEMKGAKYPDEAVMRFFFKEGLHKTPGRVVEFGCGSANNLALLFLQYGYEVVGVDNSSEALDLAAHNLDLASRPAKGMDRYDDFKTADLINVDIEAAFPMNLIGQCDVILFPGIIYYLSRDKLMKLLRRVYINVAKEGSWVFVRARGMADYRYKRGMYAEHNGTLLNTPETGEEGCRNVCYREYELVDMFRDIFHLENIQVMDIRFENRMMCQRSKGDQMLNHDIVIYGRAGRPGSA